MKIPQFSLSPTQVIEESTLVNFMKTYGGNHVSHLILLQDKEIYWNQSKTVLITFKRVGNKLVVLADPIGDKEHINSALDEFLDYSLSIGCTPVFYQITGELMATYHERGYKFAKLGEEAIVDLEQFSLAGKQGAKLRTKFNKFNREQYSFQVLYPPYSVSLLAELREISEEWLGGQKEKGFSVVAFSEDYVSSLPLALLFNAQGKIVAFATLANNYKGTITIDLMRRRKDTSYGTMDVLFIHIFQWAKEHGFSKCSLGVSPLANVGVHHHSFLSEKLIRLAFHHGNSLYNFKGLQEFKGKFATRWEPKYLAYKKSSFFATILQIMLLINKPPIPTYRLVKKVVKLKLRRAI